MSTAPVAAPGRRRARTALLIGGAVVLVVLVVVAARLILFSEAGRAFVAAHPGTAPQPADTPVGFGAGVAWTHGLNATFLLLTVLTGWRLHRGQRPTTFWTRRNTGTLRTRNPPVRIGIDLWSHFAGDLLWVLNGVAYLVLLFTTGHWLRVVPTSWDVVPAAVSAGLQYAALQWPTTDGWVAYNGLQQLSYFVVVFAAGPLAVLTGLRASPGLAARLRFLDRRFPVRLSKRIHWWTMWFLVAFTAVHVVLVLATGAVRNLNHVYALNDGTGPGGVIVFAASVVLTGALVAALRPPLVRALAARTGDVLQRPSRKPPAR